MTMPLMHTLPGFAELVELTRNYAIGGRYECAWFEDEVRVHGLLAHALAHRLLPLAASELLANLGMSRYLRAHLIEAVRVARRKALAFRMEAARIQGALRTHGIPSLARKGVVLASTVYQAPLHRMSGDIDFYCRREDVARVLAVLGGLSYERGAIGKDGEPRSLTREESIFAAMYPDHLDRHASLIKDDIVHALSVDFAVDIAWTHAPISECRHEYLGDCLSAAFELERELPDGHDLVFCFIDVLLHLYREAYFYKTIAERRDVHLVKFLDLALILSKFTRTDRLHASMMIDKLGMRHIAAWVLFHLDEVFNINSLSVLNLEDVVNRGDIDPYTSEASGATVKGWSEKSMLQRLAGRVRDNVVSATTTIVNQPH